MSLIACSRSSGHTAIRPLIFATTTATSRSATTTIRQFSTPVRTFNKLQSSAARQTPLSSVATASIRHLSSSPTGTRGFNSKATLTAEESKKITWVINNFCSLESKTICSDQFVVVAASATRSDWYTEKSTAWGCSSLLPYDQIVAKDSGFLVNGELKIVVEIDLFEAIGKLDVTEETSTSTLTETMDINGFELLPSQAKSMSRVFTRHPEIASEFCPKNATLRTCYMSFLLGMIETMCQSPQALSKDDMSSAYAALKFMTEAGFKLDWLQKKLDGVSEIKEKEKVGETHLKGMEEKLKGLKTNYLDVEAMVTKEKAKVSAANLPLSFDDVV